MRIHRRSFLLFSLFGLAVGAVCTVSVTAQQKRVQETAPGTLVHTAPHKNFLPQTARDALGSLMVQDFQGRMKPLDTLSRESLMKIAKRSRFEGWEAVDLYVSWTAYPQYWFDRPLISVRNPELRELLGVHQGTTHVTPASLFDVSGRYRLAAEVDKAHRTPGEARSKMQTKLISLDERVNLFFMAVRGITLRMFPLPGDENNRWLAPAEFEESLHGDTLQAYQAAYSKLSEALKNQNGRAVFEAARAIQAVQKQYGAAVLPSRAALRAELTLNRLEPFTWVTLPYLLAFVVLLAAYAWSLARRRGAAYRFGQPLYLLGMLIYTGALAFQIYGYVLRWIASGHAPLSNGYESMIFISLMIGVAGLLYELRGRCGSVGSLAALLTAVILGVAMLPTFDPAISPLVPVLDSSWLIIHVTVITASYGFLGLGAVIAMTMLILHLFKGPGRFTLRLAIIELHGLHWNTLVTGLAFLSVGTFLGGVWANESWGRYWGWDPKETWALVTILIYAFVVHFRFIDKLNNPLNIASGGFLAISSVGMTYFGVNYFLSGLHSYAQGEAPGVPGWVYVMGFLMIVLVFAAHAADSARSWEKGKTKTPRRSP